MEYYSTGEVVAYYEAAVKHRLEKTRNLAICIYNGSRQDAKWLNNWMEQLRPKGLREKEVHDAFDFNEQMGMLASLGMVSGGRVSPVGSNPAPTQKLPPRKRK